MFFKKIHKKIKHVATRKRCTMLQFNIIRLFNRNNLQEEIDQNNENDDKNE